MNGTKHGYYIHAGTAASIVMKYIKTANKTIKKDKRSNNNGETN